MTGRYTVVATFGEQQHAELKYVRTSNSGIDIQATPGADARAVFNGVVTRVFVVPGYNNSVIVRHGNYLTVYSNLSQVYVKAGDTVGYVAGEPMKATVAGVLRGLIADGAAVQKGLKCGDVDPRAEVSYCDTVSDKASAIGGGVLEAVLHLSDVLREQ